MHELATATLHFDPPYTGLVGGAILHGWLVPKPGHHYTDVRVRVGDTLFAGIYGYPRRDLADFFKIDAPHLLAGFAVTLTLPAGRHRLMLEGCTITGHWEPLDTIERDINRSEALPDREARAPLNAVAFGEALRVLLRQLAALHVSPATAANALIAATPPRHHLQHPPRPFHGHLDQPQIWARSLFGRLPITGWIFHETLPIKRVLATTDLQAAQELSYGRGTPFLRDRAGTPLHAAAAGYDGFLDLPAQLPQPVTVRLYAELEDGSWHLGSVARFTSTDQEFAKQPFPDFSAFRYLRAWRALAAAIRTRGWQLPSGPPYRQALRAVWHDYSHNAPRSTRVTPSTRPATGSSRLSRVNLFTHNLSREGAPLFLLEYARYLRKQVGASLTVTSAQEGPLRHDFEQLGASVRLVDPTSLFAAKTPTVMAAAITALDVGSDIASADLVVANTLSTWWAIHLAYRAGRPVLFYIHESTSPRVFFQRQLASAVLPFVESTFRLATRVSFLTAATARYYAGLTRSDNTCITPGWIDLNAIDQFRAAHPRAELRAQHRLIVQRRLVINVGTVCERKGQHIFARAVDLLWRTAPTIAASADFLMIGARDTPYDRDLAAFIARLGRSNLRLMPETASVYPLYGAADLFVCSSYEESFPRVVLEAMAFSLPIVSTSVHGIPELVRADQEALLVPPGDTGALATALGRALDGGSAIASLGQAARTRVAIYDSSRLLPQHAALAQATADFIRS